MLEGGWPLFAPQAYEQEADSIKDKIESGDFVIVSANTLAPEMQALKNHRVDVLVGQRPAEMGYKAAMVMKDLVEGKSVNQFVQTGLDTCTWDNADSCLNH